MLDEYVRLVRRYPSVFQSLEEAARSLTLLIPDRFGSAELHVESIQTVLNLLALYHSKILAKTPAAQNLLFIAPPSNNNHAKRNSWFKYASNANSVLTIFANVQVLLEMLSRKRGRWVVILTLEILKSLCRLIVLKNNGENSVLRVANANELNRELLEAKILSEKPKDKDKKSSDFSDLVELYKISGRGQNRHGNFSELYSNNKKNVNEKVQEVGQKDLGSETHERWMIFGREMIHVFRPILYVLSIMKFGYSSWTPYMISLVLELISTLKVQKGKITSEEQEELIRRRWALVFYLLRPPFFNRFSKIPITKLCAILEKLPILGALFSNLLQLLFSLQNHFYYVNPS